MVRLQKSTGMRTLTLLFCWKSYYWIILGRKQSFFRSPWGSAWAVGASSGFLKELSTLCEQDLFSQRLIELTRQQFQVNHTKAGDSREENRVTCAGTQKSSMAKDLLRHSWQISQTWHVSSNDLDFRRYIGKVTSAVYSKIVFIYFWTLWS